MDCTSLHLASTVPSWGPPLAVSTERGLTLFVLLGNVLTRFCIETGVLGGDSGIKLDKLVGG